MLFSTFRVNVQEVEHADCPLPKGAMLFSTFLSTYKKWSTFRVNVQEVEHLECGL